MLGQLVVNSSLIREVPNSEFCFFLSRWYGLFSFYYLCTEVCFSVWDHWLYFNKLQAAISSPYYSTLKWDYVCRHIMPSSKTDWKALEMITTYYEMDWELVCLLLLWISNLNVKLIIITLQHSDMLYNILIKKIIS